VTLARTDVSEELFTSTIRVAIIGVLRLLVTANTSPNVVTLMMAAIRSSETSALTKATFRHIPEDGILHLHYILRGGSIEN
jgi:hypothetical protein